jgi:bifunctional UDP-N-acetylglucosamine pyrophosphorylase / glucosamine-1-phosphate N-acetyltransferase
MAVKNMDIKKILIKKGVCLPAPESVEIGPEVDPDRISGDRVVVHAGCRILGERTLIHNGSILGHEAPATIENCYIGPQVRLSGGYFSGSVFLENVRLGSCAHVREGCILEENAAAAHSVGLKQTILFPYVTLGSLINFCDCLMSGGTGSKNHSEVGSAYIHFNFTPQQDKATPSLIGDVPAGVMLNQPPIFLGGQGGLVGPARLGFGVTVAAGTICRCDELRPNRLIFGGAQKEGNVAYTPGIYRNLKRTVLNNLIYIGNLMALMQWYRHVRSCFVSDSFPMPLLEGLFFTLTLAIDERINQLSAFIDKCQREELACRWPEVEGILSSNRNDDGDTLLRDTFLDSVSAGIQTWGRDYLQVIRGLDSDQKSIGSEWLKKIVDRLVGQAVAAVPALKKIRGE